MKTTITLEIELEVEFDYDPGTPASWDHPGDPEEVTITAVTLNGHQLPVAAFDDFSDALELAALEEVDDYCPYLDRD